MTQNISPTDQRWFLALARRAIESKLLRQKFSLDPNTVPPVGRAKLASFVTLTRQGELRGCIGHLLPVQVLWRDIVDNSCSAAFDDPRFQTLEMSELKAIQIEISVLSQPESLHWGSIQELLKTLQGTQPGVILSSGRQSATFLPQVWGELPDAIDFLTHLADKAGIGLPFDPSQINLQTYQVTAFTEP